MRLGLIGETYQSGHAHEYLRRATWLTAAGGLGALLGGRSRIVAALSGVALMGGSMFQRLAILHAGIRSTEDPRYVVEPQKARQQDPSRR